MVASIRKKAVRVKTNSETGDILELTGNKRGLWRKRKVRDDLKGFGLRFWTTEVAIY